MSNKTPRDRWPIHGGDPATYQLTPPDGYEAATDWVLEFRSVPIIPGRTYTGTVLTPTPDESALGDDPPIVAFDFPAETVYSIHDGYTGDIQCSYGTVITIELRVEDDWTE